METLGWIVLTVVLAAVGRTLVVPYRRRRLMTALLEWADLVGPRALVPEMQGGMVVIGRVRREGPLLRAPLSGRPCVAYQVVVEQPRRDWLTAQLWGRLFERQEASPFVVVSERSEALVDVSGPFTLTLAPDHSGVTDWLTAHPGRHPGLAQVLAAAGIESANIFGTWKSLSYVERVLMEDEVVGVEGPGDREVHPAGERPDPRSPPQRLVLRGTEEYPLRIADR